MAGRIWTPSNGLSLLRAALAVPITLLLLSDSPGSRTWAAVLIAIAAATDFLDGFIARRRGEVTEFGKAIDPIADKLGIGAVAVVLTVQGTLPPWFTIAVVGRDIAILALGASLSRRGAGVPQSNPLGKWTAAVLALALFAGVLDPGDRAGILLPAAWAGTIMVGLSAVSYARRLFRGDGGGPEPSS